MGIDVCLRRRLLAEGFSDRELRRLRRDGELSAVRRGAYVLGAPPADVVAHHLLSVEAASEQLSPDAVVSHTSAALVHRLPAWGVPIDLVQVTRDRRRSGGRRGARVHVHSAPLDPVDVVKVDGFLVTSVARTLVDLGRTQGFEPVVVTADNALHRHLVTRPELDAVMAMMPRWPGVPAARRALAFADPGSESVGESRSRVAMSRAGLPPPVLQWNPVRRDEVDFAWIEERTVGEFDGKVKYGRLVKPGGSPGDVVYREKLREDALRAHGLQVVRWIWADLDDFAPVAERLRRHLR